MPGGFIPPEQIKNWGPLRALARRGERGHPGRGRADDEKNLPGRPVTGGRALRAPTDVFPFSFAGADIIRPPGRETDTAPDEPPS